MAELHEAAKLLDRSPIRTTYQAQESTGEKMVSTSTGSFWAIPPHLLSITALNEAATAALNSGTIASQHPTDFDTVLQHGLNLQELASGVGSSVADQLALLQSACAVYEVADQLRPGPAAMAIVPFNHAVALSDIARLKKPSGGADVARFLTAAAEKYAEAVKIDPNAPQALNNWALVLQELAGLAPPSERQALLWPAVARFRAAIRLYPDAKLTSRFCYNLGTVLYSHACSISDRMLGSSSESVPSTKNSKLAASAPAPPSPSYHPTDDKHARAAFAHAASYIMLAFGLQPDVKIYQDSLIAVQRLLPLPYLRTGRLVVATPGSADSPEESWVAAWWALDAITLQTVRPPAGEGARSVQGALPNIAIDVLDVVSSHVCQDPSLPAGVAVWLALKDNPRGMFLVAEEREEAEGWVDALRLLGIIARNEGGADALQQALLTRRQRPSAQGSMQQQQQQQQS